MRALRPRTMVVIATVILGGLGAFRWLPGEAVGEEAASGGRGRVVAGGRGGPESGARPRGGESVGEAESAGGAESAGEGASGAQKGPRSLEGTEVDGAFETDGNGHLVMGPRVIALFDYFFSATGEEDEETLRERIAALATRQLVEPALGEALELLDRYQSYREAGRRLGVGAQASAAERLAAVRQLRRDHFGDAAGALFGDEERAAEVAIEKSAIAQDKALSADERADLLAEVDERLPASARAARTAATSVAQLRADEQALRAAGADEAEIHQFRAGTLGPEAAARLAALDEQRATWRSRIQAVREDRDRLCAGSAAQAACETALLEAAFDERERIRARAILAAPSH